MLRKHRVQIYWTRQTRTRVVMLRTHVSLMHSTLKEDNGYDSRKRNDRLVNPAIVDVCGVGAVNNNTSNFRMRREMP